MNDKTLLELAAKAAGIKLWHESPWRYVDADYNGLLTADGVGLWRPHQDDGDALRLAVELNMQIQVRAKITETWVFSLFHIELPTVMEHWRGGNRFIATRRAIVRSAAEIGKQMGEQQ